MERLRQRVGIGEVEQLLEVLKPHERVVAAEIASVLAFSAIRNNDKVGLLCFTDRIERFVPARKGPRHVLRVIRELLTLRATGRGTDIAGALDYFNRFLMAGLGLSYLGLLIFGLPASV